MKGWIFIKVGSGSQCDKNGWKDALARGDGIGTAVPFIILHDIQKDVSFDMSVSGVRIETVVN